MVSVVMKSASLWRGANHTVIVRLQPRARETRHPARADSDEPDVKQGSVGRRSSIGAEYEVGLTQTKDGADGGPAEERTCARGRGMRLFKMSRTRMRGRDVSFRTVR